MKKLTTFIIGIIGLIILLLAALTFGVTQLTTFNGTATENLTFSTTGNQVKPLILNRNASVTDANLTIKGFPHELKNESYEEVDTSYASFGQADYAAQNFSLDEDMSVSKIALKVKHYLTDTEVNVHVRIVEQTNGVPDMTKVLGTATKNVTATAFAWQNFTFTEWVNLEGGTGYWMVVDAQDADATSSYRINLNNNPGAYTKGDEADTTDNGTTWTIVTTKDALFQIYKSDYPRDTWLEIGTADGTYEWGNKGQIREGYGWQDKLNDSEWKFEFNYSGTETKWLYITLPKRANVTSAILNLTGE
jgi:hypothetical protein